MIGVIFGVFIVGLILALPVGVALGIATLLPDFLIPNFAGDLSYSVRSIVNGVNSTPILAVPLFMLSGAIMSRGGISKRLFDVFAVFIGKRTAGMPCAVIVTCLFYGAISGSGPATCAAVGAMTIPILIDLGYDKIFAGALVATAGGLGVIIPPSIPFIMFGLTTGASVGDMFTAGILPGILIAVVLMLYAYFYCKTKGEDKKKVAENHDALLARGRLRVVMDGFWALLTPVIILGGIYTGVVSPTEAACISVLYAIIICLFVYKTMKPKDLLGFFREAVSSYAPLMIMFALANAFTRVLVLVDAPAAFQEMIASTVTSKVAFLLLLNLILLILGMFMDVGAAVVILAPMLIPVASAFGIDVVHLGIIMVVNLAIGFVTPPFGLNLFVASPLIETPVMKLGRKALPFILSFIIALLLITFIPEISLALV